MSELWEYMDKLIANFNDSAMTVFMMQLLSVIYPVLAEQGKHFTAPLLICFNTKSALEMFCEVLRIFDAMPVKTLAIMPKDLKKLLDKRGGTVLILKFVLGRYTKENLMQIEAACSDSYPIQYLQNLKIVLSVGGIPYEWKEHFAGVIYISGNAASDFSKEKSNEVVRKFLSYFIQRINNEREHEVYFKTIYEEFNIFHHVGDLISSFVYSTGVEKRDAIEMEKQITRTLEIIEREWSGASDPDSYAEAFRRLLISSAEWLPSKICDRMEVTGEYVNQIDQIIFYDEKNYYLTQENFNQICTTFEMNTSSNYLKQQLADAGMLQTEGKARMYYSKEIEIVTAYGQILRRRRVVLSRKKIDKDGELTFRELMEMKGEDENNEFDINEIRSDGRYIKDCKDGGDC